MTITTRMQFLAQFSTVAEAVEAENQALSIGAEFLPECARTVLAGGDATSEYYAWLISQTSVLLTVYVGDELTVEKDRTAYGIGRECCEFWVDYLDQPGVSGDPNDWELSALDIETAAIELGVDATPEFVAALEAGFSERRRELSWSEKFSRNIR
jgi:hypothetical protein